MKWQPIKTAPKNASEFQAWVKRGENEWWEPKARYNRDLQRYEIWGRIDFDMDDFMFYPEITFTHWMPLPPPPKDTP